MVDVLLSLVGWDAALSILRRDIRRVFRLRSCVLVLEYPVTGLSDRVTQCFVLSYFACLCKPLHFRSANKTFRDFYRVFYVLIRLFGVIGDSGTIGVVGIRWHLGC